MSFRSGTIVLCLLLLSSAASASTCAQVKSRPGAWVTTKVDALVRAAYAAYESNEAIPAYQRVLRALFFGGLAAKYVEEIERTIGG